jgi:hypothetical protein
MIIFDFKTVESAHTRLTDNNGHGKEEGEKLCEYKALMDRRFDMVRNEMMSVQIDPLL